MPSIVEEEILNHLQDIEADHEVQILLAVESGSRSWGFESPDSDYDARFIYVHRPEWYVSIEEGRDVIELPPRGSLDLSGWDLRKALRLFRKSNPVLIEWLVSPLICRETGNFAKRLRALADRHYNRRGAAYHYMRMAESNFKTYLSDKTEVILKKYLYVLRPLFNIHWLMEHDGLIPMSFVDTLEGVTVSCEVREAIAKLLVAKRSSPELGTGRRIPTIDTFINDAMERVKAYCETAPESKPPLEAVNGLFRDILDETWL